jgi:hypothetical protein
MPYNRQISYGPTQCGNCQKFGHGSSNCFMKPQCIKCGENHKSAACIYNEPDKNIIPQKFIKCANCGQPHTANYSNCTKRLEYINIKQKIRQNNTKNPNIGFHLNQQNYNSKFPLINNQQNQKNLSNNNYKRDNNVPYSSFFKASNTFSNNQTNKNPDLFTNDECMDILNEFINRLQQCKSKIDQIRTIADITFKYLSHG